MSIPRFPFAQLWSARTTSASSLVGRAIETDEGTPRREQSPERRWDARGTTPRPERGAAPEGTAPDSLTACVVTLTDETSN